MDNTEECMICFEKMGSSKTDHWNIYRMACSHSICVDCATKMQSVSDESDYTISSEENEEYEYEYEHADFDGMRVMRVTMTPRVLEPEFDKEYTKLDYTMKYSLDGCTYTRVNEIVLDGFQNPMRCPYCRQHEPMIYDFDTLRYCIPKHATEWNILERKFYTDHVTSFTMSKDGATFAFKLSKDKSSLRVMWSEVNTYPFTLPNEQTHSYSDVKAKKQKEKDARAYSRPKRYAKMIR